MTTQNPSFRIASGRFGFEVNPLPLPCRLKVTISEMMKIHVQCLTENHR